MNTFSNAIRINGQRSKKLKVVLRIILALALICLAILFPFFVIGSINSLFGLSIEPTFETWMATVILMIAINGPRKA